MVSDQGDLSLFPPIERPWYPWRKRPKRKLVLGEPTTCDTCGGFVGPLTGICAACHFRGWWPPVSEPRHSTE